MTDLTTRKPSVAPARALTQAGLVAGTLGATALVSYAIHSNAGAETVGVGLVAACAATAVGGIFGFLFGIPRALAANAGTEGQRGHSGNTNLERISDWLTTALIGAGLTQIREVGSALGDLVDGLKPSFGKGDSAGPFAAGLLVYFAVVGFVGGWLVTRLFLGRALTQADALSVMQDAADAKAAGNDVEAARLQEVAVSLLAPAEAAARTYRTIRTMQPPGGIRTEMLNEVVARARRDAATYDAAGVVATYDTGDEGSRIYALGVMQARPDVADIERIVRSITGSASAFEQYHALGAAEAVAPRLDAAARARLREAVLQQRGDSGWIEPGTSRWTLSERVLRALAGGT